MKSTRQFFFSRFSGPNLQTWALQSLGPTPLAAVAPAATPDVGAEDAGFLPVVAIVVLLALIAWSVVKLYDRRRKRDEEAMALQSRLSDALMVEPSLACQPLTLTVQLPLWGRDPVTIKLSGSVPRPALRQAAIDLVLREVDSTGKDCALQDRIAITPALLGRAA